jgi:hypothetical protein
MKTSLKIGDKVKILQTPKAIKIMEDRGGIIDCPSRQKYFANKDPYIITNIVSTSTTDWIDIKDSVTQTDTIFSWPHQCLRKVTSKKKG